MKTLRRNCKRLAAVFTVLTLMLCACGRQAEPEERDWKAEAEAASVFCVFKEDCFLCGTDAGYSRQNNVGIVSLNTFAVMPVEINRYDHSGQLVEENTGAMQMRTFKNGDDGMTASVMLEPDRGIAHVSISLKGDTTLNLASAAAHLCPDCLAELAAQLHGSASGVGVINFSTRRLYSLHESGSGFGAGDYYVHFDRDTQGGEISVLITYSPLRYDNEA